MTLLSQQGRPQRSDTDAPRVYRWDWCASSCFQCSSHCPPESSESDGLRPRSVVAGGLLVQALAPGAPRLLPVPYFALSPCQVVDQPLEWYWLRRMAEAIHWLWGSHCRCSYWWRSETWALAICLVRVGSLLLSAMSHTSAWFSGRRRSGREAQRMATSWLNAYVASAQNTAQLQVYSSCGMMTA